MLVRLASSSTKCPSSEPFCQAEFKGEKSGRVSDRDSPGPGLSFPQARLFISGAGLPLFPSLDCGPWPLSACPPVWPCCLSVFGIFLFLGGWAPAVQVLGGGTVLGRGAHGRARCSPHCPSHARAGLHAAGFPLPPGEQNPHRFYESMTRSGGDLG